MVTTHQLLDDAIQTLKHHPDWTRTYLATALRARHGLTEYKANAVARRVLSQFAQDSRKRHCMRHRPVLSGETSGVFDNIVRAMEDVEAS